MNIFSNRIIKSIRFVFLTNLILLYFNLGAQKNLVPNPSFEIMNVLCSKLTSYGGAKNWSSPNYSFDIYNYANSCSKLLCCSVPYNTYGNCFQYPHSGNAYVGFFFIYYYGNNQKDYIQTKLLDTLKTGKCYYVEFFANMNDYYKLACNNISLLISDTAVKSLNRQYILANPQIKQFGNQIIKDTMNWVKVAGIYTAHGGENYVTIGNFNDDLHTDTTRFQITGIDGTTYLIDDVSVIPLDSMQLKADAGRDTTIVKGDSVWIGSRLCGLTNVVWYDAANNVIDTGVPGLWVKPTSNTFYVIEQNVCGQYSRDTVYITVAALPVIIDNYKLIIDNGIQNTVENVWVTASEVNVSHFNVQRSIDGINFITVGKVVAKGASKYSFIDNTNLTGVVYYRLEVVDKNGGLSYSEIKQLIIDNGQLIISPNPAKDFISISGGNIKEVRISDVSGRVILIGEGNKVDIRGLVSGSYYMTIEEIDGGRVVRKFVKI